MKNPNFKKTIKVGKDITYLDFIKSRIVTPKAIAEALKNGFLPNDCLGSILFKARYLSGKAIMGYDFA
ncbi:hypothetical protein IKQ26_05865 [bacterium]|nr:hypothetical protein [bacterium]